MLTSVSLLLIVPIIAALGVWTIPHRKAAQFVHLFGALLLLISGFTLLYNVTQSGPLLMFNQYIYIDAFSAFFILILVLIFFIVSIYSLGYLQNEVNKATFPATRLKHFYLGFHLFMFTMILVMVLNNLALVWIAIEFTTLVSALLIAFYRQRNSLEAAWKYLIIGSLGIAFALFGILFLFASSSALTEQIGNPFNWTVLIEYAAQLDPTWVTIGFVFVLVGYGTKAGLAPMHFWLPDAHSEAPSPISAILSGVLLNTALYGLLRIYLIANKTLQGSANSWLIFFGLFSIGLMVPFILVQRNFKRMLAYSSVEHIGVITFGIGLAGPLAIYGAMLHTINHSIVKSMLFMAAGNINQKLNTKQIPRVKGLFKLMPFTSIIYIVGILAIAGAPPFNIFISEWTIMLAGFGQGKILMTILFILFILIIFAGMTYAMSRMVFGKPNENISQGETSLWTTIPLIIPLLLMIILAFRVPNIIDTTIEQIVTLFI